MIKVISLLLSAVLIMTGCNGNNQGQQQDTKTQQQGAKTKQQGNKTKQQGAKTKQQGSKAKQQGARTKQTQNKNNQHAETRIQIANDAADRIVNLHGVSQANVLVTQRNAYVAAIIDTNQGNMTPHMERQIAQQVRATDPKIQNVYVSTNPEFVSRVNQYVRDVGQGRPVGGFVQEFTEMVRRVFPTRK